MIDSSLVETAVLAHQQFKVRQSISSAAHLPQVTDDFPAGRRARARPVTLEINILTIGGSGVLVAGLPGETH